MSKITFKGVIQDFLLQDTSLMDYLWHKVPIYSTTEIITRVIIFFLLTLILWFVLKPKGFLLMMVFLLSHFINWFFNGHGYQIFYSALGLRYPSRKAIGYILRLKNEAERRNLHVMVYGSWSRGNATSRSDIDIFILNLSSKSIKNSLKLGLLSTKYRLLALFNMLSVDIYVIDRVEYLQWRREKKQAEKPIIVSDPSEFIRRFYDDKITSFEAFLKEIRKLYV
ncbi:MAG: nucleotidyltransferase domain-containing protein [Thermofilaceae archaeon]